MLRSALLFRLALVLGLSLLGQAHVWAAGRHKAIGPPPVITGIVFVADDAGLANRLTSNLSRVLASEKIPLQVEGVPWSTVDTGADYRDQKNQLNKGY